MKDTAAEVAKDWLTLLLAGLGLASVKPEYATLPSISLVDLCRKR